MNRLLTSADPARHLRGNSDHIRHLVEQRIGQAASPRSERTRRLRPFLVGAVATAVAFAISAPLLVKQDRVSVFAPSLGGFTDMPGIGAAVPLASGGVQTMAIDGDGIWVVTALAGQVQRVSVATGEVTESYAIDAHVEGVVVGGGYLWLQSYDDGGAILRFDPSLGSVDLSIPLGSAPAGAFWFGDSLWVNNDRGEGLRVSADGEQLGTFTGFLKGEGLGYLWIADAETALISSIDVNGNVGAVVIPSGYGLVTMSGPGVMKIVAADGLLWLLDGDYPFGTNMSRFDPATGELTSFVGMTFGLSDIVAADGFLWVTSQTDDVLMRVDPHTAAVIRYPMPGKAGGVVAMDGSLWVTLYHPGALIQIDPNADLITASAVTFDNWDEYPSRLLCTGDGAGGAPTIILEPIGWIDYGSWSVIQARLSAAGFLVCANGYIGHAASPAERADSLRSALRVAGLPGPFVLVAAGDGVHALRLFAEGRDDVAGVVLVDPTPVGFSAMLDELTPDDMGVPLMLDLDPAVTATLTDFGDRPLTVIEADSRAVFLSRRFVDYVGAEDAQRLDAAWKAGLAFYAGLSTESRSVVARGTGQHMVVWDRPDLVIAEILEVADRGVRG